MRASAPSRISQTQGEGVAHLDVAGLTSQPNGSQHEDLAVEVPHVVGEDLVALEVAIDLRPPVPPSPRAPDRSRSSG
jgi:hypothetical protein